MGAWSPYEQKLSKTLIESVLCFGCDVCTKTAEMKRRINAVKMDYLREQEESNLQGYLDKTGTPLKK